MRNTLALLAALFLALATPSQAAKPKPLRPSGLYTNLRYIEEAGDLLGMELLVVPAGPNHWTAFVQISEGGEPYTVLVPFQVEGDKVEFTLPAEGEFPNEHFAGRLYENKLVLHWSHGDVETLKRGRSYWE